MKQTGSEQATVPQLEAEIDRSIRAKAVLDDPLFKGAVEAVEGSLMSEWRKTRPDDTNAREDIWRRQDALRRVVLSLRRHVETGMLAEAVQHDSGGDYRWSQWSDRAKAIIGGGRAGGAI